VGPEASIIFPRAQSAASPRVKARGQRDLITVLGHAAMISAGEFVQASGSWINDRTHGVEFRASFLKAMAPTTVEGIEKYLGSGMIRGIGPVYEVHEYHEYFDSLTQKDAIFPVIGDRTAGDEVTYPDMDLELKAGPDGVRGFRRKDGTPYPRAARD